jgi:tryptophan synthase alpha subunit
VLGLFWWTSNACEYVLKARIIIKGATEMIDQLECEHENAEIEYLTYSKPSWWADAHCYVNDDSEDLPTLVCPDCGLEEIQEVDYEDED